MADRKSIREMAPNTVAKALTTVRADVIDTVKIFLEVIYMINK